MHVKQPVLTLGLLALRLIAIGVGIWCSHHRPTPQYFRFGGEADDDIYRSALSRIRLKSLRASSPPTRGGMLLDMVRIGQSDLESWFGKSVYS